MGRPTKQGIEYFPTEVDIDKDDKLQMIIAEYGYKGEAIYLKLCSWIYKHQGYYIEWSEMEQLKFANRVAYILGNAQVNLINSVIAKCVKWGLFDSNLFNMSQILTSKRIQSTWWEATRKRSERKIDEKIWLLPVNAGFPAEETRLSAEESTQSKVKKIKEKKDKGKSPLAPTVPAVSLSVDLPGEYDALPKNNETVYFFIRDKRPEFIKPYVDYWNIFAVKYKMPEVKKINDSRKRKFAVRIKEKQFDLPAILRKAKDSEFLLTGNWFTFDWIIENDSNYLKILEGNYDKKQQQHPKSSQADVYAEERARIEERTRNLYDQ